MSAATTRRRWMRLPRPMLIVPAAIVLLLFAVALMAPLIAPYHYAREDLGHLQLPPGPGHWLGTDELGRDILSRLLYGARVSLTVAVVVEVIELLFGATLGLLAGYFGGRLDMVIMRLTDMTFAFPDIL